jgi:hypothetical protein
MVVLLSTVLTTALSLVAAVTATFMSIVSTRQRPLGEQSNGSYELASQLDADSLNGTSQVRLSSSVSSKPKFKLFKRLPTWIKQLSLVLVSISVGLSIILSNNESLRSIHTFAKVLFLLSSLLATQFDGLTLIELDTLRRLWIPVYACQFTWALIEFLNHPFIFEFLTLILSSLACGMSCFNAFVIFVELQRNEPALEYLTDLRNYITFSYMNSIIFRPALAKGTLEYEDVPPICDADSSFFISEKFDFIRRVHPSWGLSRVLFALISDEWLAQGCFQLIGSSTICISPLALEKILIYIKYQGGPQYKTEGLLPISIWSAVILLLIGPIIGSIGYGQNFVRGRYLLLFKF